MSTKPRWLHIHYSCLVLLAACGAPQPSVQRDGSTPPDAVACQAECVVGYVECLHGELRSCVMAEGGCASMAPAGHCPSGFCGDAHACGVCSNGCTLGETTCQLGLVRTCVADGNGCLAFGAPTACAEGFCESGGSCGTCANGCAAGETSCQNGQSRVCVTDQHGCRDWSAATSCTSGFCSNSQACGACVNACVVGATDCRAGAIRSCVLDAHGCLAWGPTSPCPLGTCSDAATCTTCAPESDASFCVRLGKSCGPASGTDNCGAARSVTECGPCATGTRCDAGTSHCVALSCAPGSVDNSFCGKCGHQTRTCQPSGDWGAFGPCTNETGVCAPNDKRSVSCGNCGTSRQTCSLTCAWDTASCVGEGVCASGTSEQSFSVCGGGAVASRTCDASCAWGSYGVCVALPAVLELSAGGETTCARLDDGTMKCWGANDWGQLGDGTTVDKSVPTLVAGLSTAAQIATGSDHTCALLTDGTAKCWGEGGTGGLGVGWHPTFLATPATVIGGLPNGKGALSGLSQIAAGSGFTAATGGGGVATWGWDADYQLGSLYIVELGWSSPAFSLDPVGVNADGCAAGTLPDACALDHVARVALGDAHACAALTDGTVRCWGNNQYGQVGNGKPGTIAEVASVVPGIDSVVELSLGARISCARQSNGAVRCWGDNTEGGLADGTTAKRSTLGPVAVSGATQIAVGGRVACALLTDGTVACWGLVDGIATPTPVVLGGLTDVVQITRGALHGCALLKSGRVSCWGHNYKGELGSTPNNDTNLPAVVLGL